MPASMSWSNANRECTLDGKSRVHCVLHCSERCTQFDAIDERGGCHIPNKTTKTYSEMQRCIAMAKNCKFSPRTKHIAIK